jgi:CMP-N,N'-diacetyllegionaminic acid synthase
VEHLNVLKVMEDFLFMHKYFCIIPARAGSKGVPKKNLQLIGDKPMLCYTLEAAINAIELDYCILSSDDSEAIKLATKMGVSVPFVRPPELAEDQSSTIDVIEHALNWYKEKYSNLPENIVVLQPTSPFRTAIDVDNAIKEYQGCNNQSLVSVCDVSQHPSDCIIVKKDGSIERITLQRDDSKGGRQGYERVYFIDGGIYISAVGRFLEKRIMFDNQSAIFEIPKSHGIDIDDPFDLELARSMFKTGMLKE